MFACRKNSCRSQIAEGFAKTLGAGKIAVTSSGLEAAKVHPGAIAVMQEIGIDISSQQPKAVDVFLGKTMIHYLLIVCNKAQSTCPRIWPGLPDEKRYYWPVDDPASISGTTEEQLVVFREVRDELQQKITSWLNEVSLSASINS